MQSCFSLIASASAAAPEPDCGIRFHCMLLPVCLRFQLLLPDCARFSCCSPLASASAASPDRVRFGCYSPIASASTAAPRLRPLQLLLPDYVRFNCCSPDCVRFNCCSPIASASTAARPLRLLLPDYIRDALFSQRFMWSRANINPLSSRVRVWYTYVRCMHELKNKL